MTARSPLLLLAALPALLLPGAARAGDPIDEEVKSFKDYLGTKPPADGLKNRIAEIALKKNPKIADVLLPLLGGKAYDEEVKIAVCLALGKQQSPKVVGVLKNIVDMKDADEKHPKLVAAALEGIGDASPGPQYEFLLKMGNKYLDTNSDIASAAFKGVGNNHTVQAVEDLVKAAVRCEASGGDSGPSAAVQTMRRASLPTINNALQKITGKDIKDSSVWDKWWRDNKKTWKPAPPGKEGPVDINASDTFKDDAYAFSVKRPSKVWMFRKGDGHGPYLRLEANDEGSPAAWIEIFVESVKNKTLETPEQFADADKGQIEPKFRDLKESEWAKKCNYGGLKGVEAVLFGAHKDWDAVAMHNVYLKKGEMMYRFYCVWKSGKAQSLRDDIEGMLKTGLKFID